MPHAPSRGAVCVHILCQGIVAATWSQPLRSARVARTGDCTIQHERRYRYRPVGRGDPAAGENWGVNGIDYMACTSGERHLAW